LPYLAGLDVTVDKRGRKKQSDRKIPVPGRKVRKQIGVEKEADTEADWRTNRIPGPLRKLGARRIAEMLAEDALKGKMKPMILLLRLAGCLK
jgi:hypothetical protein